jgi:hypothetical protein
MPTIHACAFTLPRHVDWLAPVHMQSPILVESRRTYLQDHPAAHNWNTTAGILWTSLHFLCCVLGPSRLPKGRQSPQYDHFRAGKLIVAATRPPRHSAGALALSAFSASCQQVILPRLCMQRSGNVQSALHLSSSIVPFRQSVFAAHVSAAHDCPCLAGGLQDRLFASPSRRAPERYKEEKPEAAVGLCCFFLLRARLLRWTALRPSTMCMRFKAKRADLLNRQSFPAVCSSDSRQR